MATPMTTYKPPDPLQITGSELADNWRRFCGQWENYVIANDLREIVEAESLLALDSANSNRVYWNIHCVQKKHTHIFFHISKNYLWI